MWLQPRADKIEAETKFRLLVSNLLVISAAPLDFVHRACIREASRQHQRLSRGIYALAIIARTAPWFGVLLTWRGIVAGLGTPSGNREMARAFLNWNLAEALLPTVFGIAVALLASWIHRFLTAQLGQRDLEMHTATLDLLNRLPITTSTPAIVEPLDRVREACLRASRRELQRLRQGLHTLASVAEIAPYYGIAAGCILIIFVLTGKIGGRGLAPSYAELFTPVLFAIAWGLALGVSAAWGRKLLTSRVDGMDLEMQTATLDLLNQLHALSGAM